MPMERVHKPLLLLLIFLIAFLSLTTSGDGQTANSGNRNAKSGDKQEARVKGDDQTRIPSVGYPYPGEIIGYPRDPYDSLASMYFPASAAGSQDMGIGKDGHRRGNGLEGALFYSAGGYQPGYYGTPPVGHGYPYQGGIFGFPRGIFGFPLGFRGFPGSVGGFPGGYGGSPGGYGGFPQGPGGYPGGYGGFPGGYGSGGPGYKPGGGGSPGYGGKAEVKGKEVNRHD